MTLCVYRKRQMDTSEAKRKHVPDGMTLGFIGAGRMAQAMAKGFIETGKSTSTRVCTCAR